MIGFPHDDLRCQIFRMVVAEMPLPALQFLSLVLSERVTSLGTMGDLSPHIPRQHIIVACAQLISRPPYNWVSHDDVSCPSFANGRLQKCQKGVFALCKLSITRCRDVFTRQNEEKWKCDIVERIYRSAIYLGKNFYWDYVGTIMQIMLAQYFFLDKRPDT